MKLFYVLLMVTLILSSGCVTTAKVVPAPEKAEVGEAHGLVNHCQEDRVIIVDGDQAFLVSSMTSKEVKITNGRHRLDFYQVLPSGPKFYASITFEVKTGEWLVAEMFPAK